MAFNKLDVLVRCAILLYRETLVEGINDSKALVKTLLLQMGKERKLLMQGEAYNITTEVKSFLETLLQQEEPIDKDHLIMSFTSIFKDNPKMLELTLKEINREFAPDGAKKSILRLQQYLTGIYKQQEIAEVISKAAYRLKIGDVGDSIGEFTNRLIANLEVLSTDLTSKQIDKAIVDEIDIDQEEDLSKAISKAKKNTTGDGRLKTGWRDYNKMLNGGFRLGETVLISALQHNYKSGMLRSLFAQLCMYNKPIIVDKNKVPLNVFISFEDDSDIAVEFFYKYLYYSENNELPDMSQVSESEISSYIKNKLRSTGYAVKLLRVNPSEWDYKKLINKLVDYESKGYKIQVLVTDYLSKLPTTYCDTSLAGSAFRNMLTVMRDFTSANNILFINAHQLSTEAKMLVRNHIGDQEFVKEIAGKGYYEGSKQLDHIADVEVHQHIANVGEDESVLTIQRGKRRYAEIVSKKDKYFVLPFPVKIPCIPPDTTVDGTYIGFKYAPSGEGTQATEDDLF